MFWQRSIWVAINGPVPFRWCQDYGAIAEIASATGKNTKQLIGSGEVRVQIPVSWSGSCQDIIAILPALEAVPYNNIIPRRNSDLIAVNQKSLRCDLMNLSYIETAPPWMKTRESTFLNQIKTSISSCCRRLPRFTWSIADFRSCLIDAHKIRFSHSTTHCETTKPRYTV